MDGNLINLEDIDLGEEGVENHKLNKFIIIIPIITISITIIIIIISIFLFSNKEAKEVNKNNSEKEDSKKEEDNKDLKNLCKTGENDECLTCENNQCSSCNYRYELMNGTCYPTFSIKTTYKTNFDNETIDLIFNVYEEYIIDMEIDKEIIEPTSTYTFNTSGNHTVYFTLNYTEMNTFNSMFSNLNELTSIYFSKDFDTQNITSLKGMFFSDKNLLSVDISNINTKNIKDMALLFYDCSSLISIKFPNSSNSNLLNINNMFENCHKLTNIDLSNFNTQNIEEMISLFSGCNNLISINFTNINTQNLKKMDNMFLNCASLKAIDITNFNTQNVTQWKIYLKVAHH